MSILCITAIILQEVPIRLKATRKNDYMCDFFCGEKFLKKSEDPEKCRLRLQFPYKSLAAYAVCFTIFVNYGGKYGSHYTKLIGPIFIFLFKHFFV